MSTNTQRITPLSTRCFHILGHSNDYLSFLIDALIAIHPRDELQITIVSNIPVDDPTPYDFSEVDSVAISETTSDCWDGEAENVLLGVPNPETKRIVYAHFRDSHGISEADYLAVVHPAAVVARQTIIGPGAHVGPGSVIAPYVTIGAFTIINRNASIGHHTIIGPFSEIDPGANVAGKCRIGEAVRIGMGTSVVHGIAVGEYATVAPGAVVTKDIPSHAFAGGVPARVMRTIPRPNPGK